MNTEVHRVDGAMRWLIVFVFMILLAIIFFGLGWASRDTLEAANAETTPSSGTVFVPEYNHSSGVMY